MKTKVISELKNQLAQKLAMYASAMLDAKQSAQSETKSSAGDKYETARSMSQMEYEMQNAQHKKVQQDLSVLEQIQKLSQPKYITEGSLISTNLGYYFIAISFGKIFIDGKEVIALSKNTPLAKQLINKCKGDFFIFNALKYSVLEIE